MPLININGVLLEWVTFLEVRAKTIGEKAIRRQKKVSQSDTR